MGNGYTTQTLKVKSKMASQRMKAHVGKKENAMIKTKRGIAQLIADDKVQSARIKVEGVLREEGLMRVYEWLEMMCDLIHQRVKQIEAAKKECPEDLLESICTILYCAKRVDIPELAEIGGQFKAKWGDKWFNQHIENKSGRVSKQIIEKLSPQPPKRATVDKKMLEIATKYDLDWAPGQDPEEEMPSIIGHRNEYTVEFDSKPFGMEWTATEDGSNLWVSNVTPMSQAARCGVVPGSVLVSLNGIDIQNLGAPSIHEKASSLGLPLRVTFRKPEQLNAPKNKKDFSVREQIVNQCVKQLKTPQALDMSNEQKGLLCKKLGANPAEIASAIFLANYTQEHKQQMMMQQQQQIPQQQYVQPMQPMQPQQPQYVQPIQPMQPQYQQPMQPQQPPQYVQPIQPQQPQYQQPMQPQQPAYGYPPQNNNYPSPHDTPQQPQQPPPSSQPQQPEPEPPSNNNGGDDLMDLEARFAALKNGI
eukprot:327157_1